MGWLTKTVFSVLAIVILTIAFVFINPLQNVEAQTNDFRTFTDSFYNFKIQYPSDWIKTRAEDPWVRVMFNSPEEGTYDKFIENVRVITEKTFEGDSIFDYTETIIMTLKASYPYLSILESSETTLAGIPAHKIVFTNKDEYGFDYKSMSIWTINGQDGYYIVFSAEPSKYSSFLPTVEKMIDSFEILGLPTPISGSYFNPQVGLEIDFPEGWAGIELKEDVTIAMVTSGITIQPFAQSSALSSQFEFSMIMILVGDFDVLQSTLEQNIPPETQCEPHSSSIIDLNGMIAHELLTDCTAPEIGTVKGLQYMLATREKAILVMYFALSQDPDKTFHEEISSFQESLKTLKVDNTIDILDPEKYAALFGQTVNKFPVLVDNKMREIEIVSDTRLDKFSFDYERQELSFKIVYQEKTSEDTTVYIDDFLTPPYTVTIDEYKPIDDFLVTEDKKTGRTTISFYKHDGMITITGSDGTVPSVQKEVTKPQIPDWVRNNAKWWAEGAIADNDFVSGIQYLIKEKIIQIPETAKVPIPSGSEEIPSWIKNNADWWSLGLISDDDFVKGIQYLVEQGIIRV